MKKLAIIFTSLLLLSACSNQSSIDDQVKLIEYEKCLDIETSWFLQQFAGNDFLYGSYRDQLEKQEKILFNWINAECERYKP